MKSLSKILSGAVFLFFLAENVSTFAADISILVGSGGDRFVPATTNIAVNDRVIWTWAGLNHNVTSTSTPQAWTASPTKSSGTFTNVFGAAGSYPYECSIHVSFGMVGSITVTAPNSPPTISITNPADGAVFAAPANLIIQASASDSDGSVTNVQFLVGSNVLTNDNATPFSATTNNLAAASYTLTAIAADNSGATATDSVSISVVTPIATSLTNAAKFSGTNFQFNYPANVGLSYVVQRSTDLINWISLVTNTASSNPVVFVDAAATNTPNFYRVGRMPNP